MAVPELDDGCGDWLEDLTAGAVFSAMYARLYQNNHTPVNTDGLGSYTESTFAGYTKQGPLVFGAVTVAAHVASTTAAAVTLAMTAGVGALGSTVISTRCISSAAGCISGE